MRDSQTTRLFKWNFKAVKPFIIWMTDSMCVLSKRYKYNKILVNTNITKMKLIFLHLKFYISNMEFDSDAFNTGFHEHFSIQNCHHHQ
jgi:hypothetical protein